MLNRILQVLQAFVRVMDTLLSVQLPHASANGIRCRRE